MPGSMYCAILDTGRRCQSCCNRTQFFGGRDKSSGWMGDCRECNIRWYRGQIRAASHGTKRMVAAKRLWGFGLESTELVYRFAGLDIKFERRGLSFDRRRSIVKCTLTEDVVDQDREDSDGEEEALLRLHPLTLLDRVALMNLSLKRELLRGLPWIRGDLSVLDVVAVFLINRRRPEDLLSCSSSSIPAVCTITRVQAQDYVFEDGWRMYQSWNIGLSGPVWRNWMYNSLTEECFYTDSAVCMGMGMCWEPYRYGHAVWWLNGKRWFWERTDGD